MKTPNLAVRQKGDLVIIDMNGSLNQTDGRQAFRKIIGRLSEDHTCRILVNMAGIADLSHAGLQALQTGCVAAAGAGTLKFLNVNKRVKAHLKRVGMYDVFATREKWAWTMASASASAGSLHAPGSEYFFG